MSGFSRRVFAVIGCLAFTAGCSDKSSGLDSVSVPSSSPSASVSESLPPEYDEAIEIATKVLELERQYLFINDDPRPPFPEEEFSRYVRGGNLDVIKEDYEIYDLDNLHFDGVDKPSYTLYPNPDERREDSVAQVTACIDYSGQTAIKPGGDTVYGSVIKRKYFLDKKDGDLKIFYAQDRTVVKCED